MKVRFSDFVRTNLGFPSEWKGKSIDGADVVFSFRHGRLKIFENSKLLLTASRDEFDISGYLSDEDLIVLLKKHDLLSE